jgi:hypothetical protein
MPADGTAMEAAENLTLEIGRVPRRGASCVLNPGFPILKLEKKIDVFDRAGLQNRPCRSAHARIPPIRCGFN